MTSKLALWLLTALTAFTIVTVVYVGVLLIVNFCTKALEYMESVRNVYRSYTHGRKVVNKDNGNGD